MIRPNWEIFSAKFSTNKETTFEWFAYLLFCREFNLSKGWFGFKNQSGIEKNPIEYENEVIGFQAKFYSTSLSDHKDTASGWKDLDSPDEDNGNDLH